MYSTVRRACANNRKGESQFCHGKSTLPRVGAKFTNATGRTELCGNRVPLS